MRMSSARSARKRFEMKPPRKPGSSNVKSRGRTVSSSTKKRKRLQYRSPRETRGTGKKNVASPRCGGQSPNCLTPHSFNLSDLNGDLLSCVDKIDFDLISSTPLLPKCLKSMQGAHATFAPQGGSSSDTSPLFDLSSSQGQDNVKLHVNDSALPHLASFITTPSKDNLQNLELSQWGIPDLILERYAKRGITTMYKWQAECLMLPGILQGGNLVFSAPTSAGKTFIAELLALKCVLEAKKKVLIILPFVSIAREKANYLQSIFEPNGVKVGGFMGGHSPVGGFAAVDIAICTIEKANSLVNRLLEEGGMSELGTVVVDELHMIGDSHRGYLLELLLTKLLYVSKRNTVSEQNYVVKNGCSNRSDGIQIIGMSATLPNLGTLSNWLDAQLYCTNYRPVPLQEMVKVGSTVFDTNFKKIRDFKVSESASDEGDIIQLCEETVSDGHSVLIFCPTKQWCETLAGAIARAPFLQNTSAPPTDEDKKNRKDKFLLKSGALLGVLEQLRKTQVGMDGILEKTVPNGVAFHHAGLTFDEREIVEGAFRQGIIIILVATSTLSSGVNLPARLVIVRTPFFQRSLLDVLSYKQMVGRAGRKGVDNKGESILICKLSEQVKVSSQLFQSVPKAVKSCLDQNRGQRSKFSDVSPLRRALLEVIASGVATSQMEVVTYVKCTLLYAEMNTDDDVSSVATNLISSTTEYLLANEFIALRSLQPNQEKPTSPRADSVGEYYATQLGAATVASALAPEEALVVFSELRKAQKNFVLESELHIIYLVTPVYIQEQWPSIDWYRFLCLLERLPADGKHVANTLGIQESFLAGAVQGRIPERTQVQRERLRIHRRFFTALALNDLVHEAHIVYVARKYSVSKGLLQSLQSAAGTFSGMVTVFCSRLGWKNLELLLSQFQSRLSFGVERELCDLVRISFLNGFRARALYNSGFHSLSALATANPIVIERCLRNAVPFKSSKFAATDEMTDCDGLQRESTMWCTKTRRGLTECEVAFGIICEAQKILSEEMNIPLSAWKTASAITKQVQKGNYPVIKRNDRVSGKRRRSCVAEQHMQDLHVAERIVCFDEKNSMTTTFKTPKQRKSMRRKGNNVKNAIAASPIIASSDATLNYPTTINTTTPLQPVIFPCVKAKEEDSISYSPLFSPSDHPLTISDSFPCSVDMSTGFGHATLAMIDAACREGEPPPDDMSCSLISIDGDAKCKAVAESPAPLSDDVKDRDLHASLPDNSSMEFQTKKELICTAATFNTVSQPAMPSTQSRLRDLSLTNSSQVLLSQSGACIIDVTSNSLLFQTFVSECLEQRSFSYSVALSFLDSVDAIGIKVVEPETMLGIPIPYQNEQVVGVAICWGSMDIYYISLCKPTPIESGDCIPLASRVRALYSIFQSTNCREVITYSLKKHLKTLAKVFGIIPTVQSLDPQVVDWMLNPDGKEKTIHKMVLHYLPDQPLLSEGEDHEEMPLSSLATHASEPHVRAAAESLLASLLISKMRPLLEEEGLYKPFVEVEMPSMVVLTQMELNGIGFSRQVCDTLKDMLQLRLLQIENEAYSHARRSFSLTSPEDIAQVLFIELQLPTDQQQQKTLGPNRRGKRRIQHLSTAKDVLEKLKPLHPLPGLILEWRRVSSTVTKTVFPLFKEAVFHTALKSVRIHSTYHIHTATGRVATSDPNLQMVPKEYDIGSKTNVANLTGSSPATHVSMLLSESQCFKSTCSNGAGENEERHEALRSSVSMRSVFVPFPGGIFLAADYSQLELRVLAHMSGDTKLQRVLNSDGDVFKMIAGEWLGVPAAQVTGEERQNAKQICYGMVYGIGPKALGEQLNISKEDAAQFMETFKSKYPAMKKFVATTVQSCKDKGYIVTLLGRKRYLSGIHSQNVHARSHAERQAINSTIQGSAADLVKTAMINIDRALTKEYKTSQFLTHSVPITADPVESPLNNDIRGAYLVLQLHDELLYEVWERDLPRVMEIVQYQMENALQLSVKFPVKVQVGSSWGNLRAYSHPL